MERNSNFTFSSEIYYPRRSVRREDFTSDGLVSFGDFSAGKLSGEAAGDVSAGYRFIIKRKINQSVSQSINQSTNQSINQSINQRVIKTINRSIKILIEQ